MLGGHDPVTYIPDGCDTLCDGDGAVAEIRKLLERDPGDLAAHGALGRALLASGQHADALKGYAELLGILERRGLLQAAEHLE